MSQVQPLQQSLLADQQSRNLESQEKVLTKLINKQAGEPERGTFNDLKLSMVAAEAKTFGMYSKIFGAHLNEDFAKDLELAFRGAFVITLFGFPLVITGMWDPKSGDEPMPAILQTYIDSKIFTTGVCLMFVYTLVKNVGDTIAAAKAGVTGTSLAVFASWVMWGFCPHGAFSSKAGTVPGLGRDEVSDFCFNHAMPFGFAMGTFLIAFTIFINVAGNVKVMMSSFFVWWWMSFVNDAADSGPGLTTGFSFDIFAFWRDPTKGGDFATLFSVVGAAIFAVIATLVPYPLFAFRRAQHTSRDVAQLCGKAWAGSLLAFCNQDLDKFKRDRMIHDISALRKQMATLSGDIESSWWECLGGTANKKWGHARKMMSLLEKVLNANVRRLNGMVATLGKRPFEASHQLIMQHCEPAIFSVVKCSAALMIDAANAAADGDVDDKEEEKIDEGIKKVERDIKKLTDDFREAQRKVGQSGNRESLLNDQCLCYQLCCYGRLVIDYAKDLRAYDDENDAKSGKFESFEQEGITSVFKVSALKANAGTAVRNTLCIVMGFVLGYYGVVWPVHGGTDIQILSRRDATISGIICVLLGGSVGSAIVKNLTRLQGTVLGTMVGLLLYGLMESCSVAMVTSRIVLVFFYMTVTMFIYYHSTSYGVAGMLLAAIGSGKILQSCGLGGAAPPSDPKTMSYNQTANTIVAAVMLTVVDLLLDRERAATKTVKSLRDTWEAIELAITDFKARGMKEISVTSGGAPAALGTVETVCSDAMAEPRFWRVPWEADLFGVVKTSTYQVLDILRAMQHAAASKGPSSAHPYIKLPLFEKAMESRNLEKVFEILLSKAKDINTLLCKFEHEDDSRNEVISKFASLQNARDKTELNWSMYVTAFCKEEGPWEYTHNVKNIDTLEATSSAAIGMLVTCIIGLFAELDTIVDEILKA